VGTCEENQPNKVVPFPWHTDCRQTALLDFARWTDTEDVGQAQSLYRKVLTVNKFESNRLRLKIGFVVFAILLPIVLPSLAPVFGIHEGGRISLSGLQVLYAVLSVEIATVVYIWGVGKWSRYEPPLISSSSTAQESGVAQTPVSGSTSPSPSKPGPPAQGAD
jgi:hypothetical protein